MPIDTTSLYQDAMAVAQNVAEPIYSYFTCEIIIGGFTVTPLKVTSLTNVQDFESGYSDEINITVMMGVGDYDRFVYPYRDNLEMVVYDQPVVGTSGTPISSLKRTSYKYRAIPHDVKSNVVAANVDIAENKDEINKGNIKEYTFQLLDNNIEQLRGKMAGAPIARKVKVAEIIKTVLGKASASVEVDDSVSIKGIELVEPNNTKQRDHIVIPPCKFIDYIDELQNRVGIYSSGVGFYLSERLWWVWPMYDITRFETAKYRLDICCLPPNRFPGGDKTWLWTGNTLVMVSSSQANYSDFSDRLQISSGNGLRFGKASTAMESWSSNDKNIMSVKRQDNNNEFVTTQRKTGVNNLVPGSVPFTDNIYREMSNLASKQGAVMQLAWNFSAPKLLNPGQAVRLRYVEGNNVRTLYGVILKAEHFSSLKDTVMTSNVHITNTILTLFLGRYESGN